MNTKYRIPFILLLSFIFSLSHSQVRQGQWRDHLSYLECYKIAEMGEWIYCSAESGLISYNKNNYNIRKHSKATGLSDVVISTIEYSPGTNYLIIGYKNGNIDLLREGEAPINISDIKRKIMATDKSIYNIYIKGKKAYLSCGFGIVLLNIERREIEESYILGESGSYLRINDLTIYGSKIYAATEAGILTADTSSENLLDYNNWNRVYVIPQPEDEYKQIEVHNNRLFALYNNSSTNYSRLITFTESNYQQWNHPIDTLIHSIASTNGYFTISSKNKVQVYSENDILYMDFAAQSARHTYVTAEGGVYNASSSTGFTQQIDNENRKWYIINGPRYNAVNKVKASGNHLWFSSGGPNRLYEKGAAYSFIDETWTSYTSDAIPTTQSLGNTHTIAIDPGNPEHVFLSAYTYGLIEFMNGEVSSVVEMGDQDVFNNIREIVGIRIGGMDFDSDNNLWIVMDLVSGALFKIDPQGNWSRPAIPGNTLLTMLDVRFVDLLVTSNDEIWILTKKGEIIVLEEQTDGSFEYREFYITNQFETRLTIGYCLEEDAEGNVWVGTNNGPVVYFPGSTTGHQFSIRRNDGTDNIDILLSSNAIYEIAVDGGNRKWFATDNSGVFLLSDNNEEILENFRMDNSPMLSNSVTGIDINDVTGEVFFATNLGVLSYGGIATEGFSNFNNAYVYPNPVRPHYEGDITITGLVENSIVKITDIGGNLVWEKKSLGGRIVWDGRNFSGKRVASGVYLIMLATEDGTQSHIIKLLFLH